jgi:carboxyl-terminal processing protease
MNKDSNLKEKRESWFESLTKDIYVEEALNILDDLKGGSDAKKGLTTKVKKEKLIKS